MCMYIYIYRIVSPVRIGPTPSLHEHSLFFRQWSAGRSLEDAKWRDLILLGRIPSDGEATRMQKRSDAKDLGWCHRKFGAE